MYEFKFDPTTGILRVKVVRSWTLPEVERYGRETGPQFALARSQTGRLLLLLDLQQTDILSQEILDPLAKAGMQHSQASDRVAIFVKSMLLKLQMKRMIGEAPTPIFLSLEEAEAWLKAD
jgi:hypothetical protein